jgi:hypothetical protein
MPRVHFGRIGLDSARPFFRLAEEQKMKTYSRLLILTACALLLPSVVNAADPGNPREACKGDAETFCKGVQPGGGRIMDCLKDHFKDISDACYSALNNAPPGPGNGGGQNAGPPPPGGPPQNGNDGPDDKQ